MVTVQQIPVAFNNNVAEKADRFYDLHAPEQSLKTQWKIVKQIAFVRKM
jgi:hypothetical protein